MTQLEFMGSVDLRAVHGFEDAVRRSGGWVLGRQLLGLCGQEADEVGLRKLRALASASVDVISGDRGYCHVDHASIEEIRHCADRLLSQIRSMEARVVRLQRKAHERLHAGASGPVQVVSPVAARVVLPEEISGGAPSPHESASGRDTAAAVEATP